MKKGYTLVELLVAIACATIVLTTISATIFFVSKSTKEVISNSEINYKLTNLRDYIVNNNEELIGDHIKQSSTSEQITSYSNSQFEISDNKLYIKLSSGDIKYTMSDTPITNIYYYKDASDSSFLRCMINYNRSNNLHDTYNFIVKEI